MPLALLGGIAAAGSIGGGLLAKSGADAQANAVTNATNQSNAIASQQYWQNRSDQMPWLQSGAAGVNELAWLLGLNPSSTSNQFQQSVTDAASAKLGGMKYADALKYAQSGGNPNISPSREVTQSWIDKGIPFTTVNGIAIRTDTPGATQGAPADAAQHTGAFGSLLKPFGMEDFQTDPGYQFRLSEGQKYLDRKAAASGNFYSGANIKSGLQFNQNFASNEYTNAFNRYNINQNNTYNRLAGISGMGQQAVNQITNQGTGLAENSANNYLQGMMGAANARASGYAAMGQGIQNAGQNALTAYFLSQQGGKG